MLREQLIAMTEPTVVVIETMALIVVAGSTVFTFVGILRICALRLAGNPIDNHERRRLWLGYGRWLVAGLTFLLAADILESSIAPNWQSIAQLGAIAVIRTFLNYFLEQDLGEVGERDTERRARASPSRQSAEPH